MKRLWVGSTASLNRKWSDLASVGPLIWLVKSRDSIARRWKVGLPKEVKTVFEWPFLCIDLLNRSEIPVGRLFGEAEIHDVIRAALRDGRCASIAEYQGVIERPGTVRLLADKLKRTASLDFADAESRPLFDHEPLRILRGVYREKLESAGGIDVPGLFLKFLAESQAERLQKGIELWHACLAEAFGDGYALAIPRADQMADETEKLTKAVTQIVIDGFRNCHLGFPLWPGDGPERLDRLTEDWRALGGEIDVPDSASAAPEQWFLTEEADRPRNSPENVRFVRADDTLSEIRAAVEFLCDLIDQGKGGDRAADTILVHTPQKGLFLEHLVEAMNAAGLPVAPQATPLIEKPLVRTILDVAAAIDQDWPAEALADLLRHPDFRAGAFVAEPLGLSTALLAQQAEKLGNVSGIDMIRRFLLVRLDEEAARRGERSHVGESLYAVELLTGLESILAKPYEGMTWSRSVESFREIVDRLFEENMTADESVTQFWAAQENEVGAAAPDEMAVWSWTEFYQEAHQRAEQRTFKEPKELNDGERPARIRVVTGETPLDLSVDHLVCVGMTEGHFPSRSRIRRALSKSIPVDLAELEAEEKRAFRRLVGSAVETLRISFHARDDRGTETEEAGFLRGLHWEAPATRMTPAIEPTATDAHGVVVSRLRAVDAASPFSGEFQDPRVLSLLHDRFGPGYRFSATSLEAASLCPFRFFGTYLLGLAEDEADDDLATDYLAEGETVHAVLEELHRSLSIDALAKTDDDSFRAMIAEIVREKHPCPERLADSEFGRARWEVQNRRIENRLGGYAEQLRADLSPPSARSRTKKANAETEFGGDLEVLHCEVRAGDGTHQPAPLEIRDPASGHSFRIGGRIDRIDGRKEGPMSQVRLLDYKTGAKIGENAVREKLHLQLPIYALMVHGNSFGGSSHEVRDIGFWYLKRSLGGYQSVRAWLGDDVPLQMERLRGEYEPFLIRLVGKLRGGHFSVKPREYGCENRCALSEVCRIREKRARRDRANAAAPSPPLP